MPPKRAKRAVSEASSDLSSAPSVVEEIAEAVQQTEDRGTKRKRETAKATTKTNGQSTATVETESVQEAEKEPGPSAKRARQVKKQLATTVEVKGSTTKPKTTRKTKAVKVEEYDEEEDDHEEDPAPTATAKRKATKQTVKADVEAIAETKTPRKRKTKEEKEAEMQPLKLRNLASKMIIGAHVSAAGGVGNAVTNSVHIGANAFALFLKSQRKWVNPPLEPAACSIFHENCKKHNYDQNRHVVPHGSYLVNLAHTDKDRTKQAYDSFLEDLQRCEKLGIKLYNFHPGNCLQVDRAEAIKHLASNLNRAHKETSTVITLLENMAAGGNVLGSTFEDLRDIISHVEDKSRVGVCLDTCHAFAGGYDLRTKDALESTLDNFDKVVGMKYLRALHLNDSKAPFHSHRDLHANIGTGFLGLRAFHAVVNEPRFEGLPMVLETPIEVRDENGNVEKDEKGKEKEDRGIWAAEIKMLEEMVGMDLDSKVFTDNEERLQKKGAPERQRIMEQVEKKEEKKTKALTKTQSKLNFGKGAKPKPKKKKADSASDLSELDSE